MNRVKDCLSVMVACMLPFFGMAQPACVTDNCCCGTPIEVGVPCGDFEAPPFANPIIVYFPGEMFCDWTVYSGSIDVLGPNYSNWASGNPNGASQFIDLHGNTPGSFGTTLTGLTVGYSYTLVLWYAKNAGATTANCQVQVANGAWLDETFTASNNGADGWLEKCYTFVAQATSANLSFTGSGGVTAGGVLLDDITLWGCPVDVEPPTIGYTPPSPLLLECNEPIPPPDDLQVTDDCSAQVEMTFEEDTQQNACFYTIQRSWVFSDECGNTTTAEQEIEIQDTQPPEFLVQPTDFYSNCGDDYLSQFYDWVLTNGGGVAQDNCDLDIEWLADYLQEPDGSCGVTPVTFTITDDCGNSSSFPVAFIVLDLEDPVLLTPAEDLTVYCPPDPASDMDAWLLLMGGATAEDECDPLVWSHDFNGDYTPAIIPVTFTATDGCGNQVTSTAIFYQVTSSDTLLQMALTCDPLLVGADTMIVSQEGCETVTITSIQLAPSDTLYVSASTCDPALAGTDTLFLTNGYGCDSLEITITSLLPSDIVIVKDLTCDPNLVGLDTLIIQNQYGCDSLVITQTDLLPSSTKNIQLYTCDPSEAGLDTLYLTNQYGCDSIVYLNTTYTGIYQETNQVFLCGKGIPYSDTVTIISGPCDSLFITDYGYYPLDTIWQMGTTCQTVLAGIFVLVFPDANGCDSTVITNVILLPSDTTLVEGVTCNPAEEVNDIQTLSNQWGCDSTVFTSIMYIGVDTQFVQKTSCDPAQVGVVIQTIPGSFCDTIRVTETTWVAFTESRDTLTLCQTSGPASDTLFLTNQSGCDSLVIRAYQYTDLSADVEIVSEHCAGDADGEITVTQVLGGTMPYQYRLGSGPWQSGTLFSDLAPGIYSIEIVDGNDCALLLSGLAVSAGSTLTLDAGPDREASVGDLINLSVQSNLALQQVQWASKDVLACPTCTTTLLGPLTESQTVQVSGWSVDGCPGSDQINVLVKSRIKVFIPNSFSPNDDGINDFFTVYSDEDEIVVRNLAIYDRWGNALFSQSDLPVNDPSAGWDGRFRGDRLDPGVYVYVVEIEFPDGSLQLFKGDIAIVR
ncbi:MAG: gliding motility-associated C-terminal domain-containing protein [Saprospiraceae bacterium]|nr:gliding motility-associated C-terminal domain-containing protein [Saprospiraceae bacterium]